MVDVASVEMISVVVAAMSVAIGVFIGVTQLRDMNKTRQYQFWIEIMGYFTRERDFLSRRLGMLTWQWEDYDDFMKKYISDHESRVILWQVLSYYDMIGGAVKNNIMKVISWMRKSSIIYCYSGGSLVPTFWRAENGQATCCGGYTSGRTSNGLQRNVRRENKRSS